MKRLIGTILFFFSISLLSMALHATETIVVGDVVDKRTGEPIERANIYFRNTTIGCSTNNEGLFLVRADLQKKATLIVSAIGYKQQRYTIEPGTQSGLRVELEEDNTLLADVLIVPDDYYTQSLLTRARLSRNTNDRSHDADPTTLQEQRQLMLSDLTKKSLQRKVWQNMKEEMLIRQDSTYLLPLFYSTQDFQYAQGQLTPLTEPDTHTAGMTAEDYALLFQTFNTPLNFYKNTVSILGKQFVSPLALIGNNHYDYFLLDSIYVPYDMADAATDSTLIRKQYIIRFKSQNPYDYCFNGQMTIDSLTAAIMMLQAEVPADVNVNYLRSLRLQQTYSADLTLQDEQIATVFDIAASFDTTSHIFPTALFYRRLSRIDHDTLHAPVVTYLTTTDSIARNAIDSLAHEPLIRFAKLVADVCNTGNLRTGTCVDIGNVLDLIGGFDYEGLHIGLPFTTNEKFSKHVELSACVAYGFKDHAYKGKGQIRYRLPTDKRHIIGAYYQDHYQFADLNPVFYKFRENDVFGGTEDFMHMLLESVTYTPTPVYTAARQREMRLWTENEWTKHLSTEFDLRIGRMGYGSPMLGYHQMPSYKYKTLQAELRWGFQERTVDIFMMRYYVHSRYPVLRLFLEAGSYQTDMMERERLYARISASVQQTINLPTAGRIDYAVAFGKVFGRVPYPMLQHFVGNQSYAYDPYRFTLMDHYQFAADLFLMGHLHWDMQGLLFNHIPFVQRLHMHELFEAKIAWGSLSSTHAEVLPLPNNLRAPSVPYLEAGVGIGNILRIIDVYAIFRLTHNDANNGETLPWWGIRTRFALGL